jgi:diguanylate cyclase (GGDEF)-like protein/PAS domain S-box-containing protein
MNGMNTDFEAIIENMYDGLYIVDNSRKIIYWNAAAERITGYSKNEVIGYNCADNILIHVDETGCELCKNACPLSAVMGDGISREADIFLNHKAGHRVSVSARITPLKNDEGTVVGGIELFSESLSQLRLKQQIRDLERLALLDSLTELPNRRHLSIELIAQCAISKRTKEYGFGILYMDIDHFKRVNDRHGHAIGDRTLQVIAKTITNSVRPYDTIGRWGGEEFLGIFPNITRESLSIIAQRILALTRKSSIETEQGSIHVTISLGGLLAQGVQNSDVLIEQADALMYQSKQLGRNRATVI